MWSPLFAEALGFGVNRLTKRFFVGDVSASKCYTTVVGSRADMTEGSFAGRILV